MLRCLLSHLTGPMNFSLVTHEMLGDLYERALVAERKVGGESFVKLKGVHYTPLSITRQILDRIPLEFLPPSQRSVCDFACGSGSFLLAATERLAKLFDPREPESPEDALSYLKNAVFGNDIDRVAILVARLSYLLAYWNRTDLEGSVPYPHFHKGGDALTLDLTAAFGRRPRVIVSNPPFDVEGQPASSFLLRRTGDLVSKRGGLAQLPWNGDARRFPDRRTDIRRKARENLLRVTDLLDVWELPEHAIGQYAEAPTCVILAEVGSKPSGRRLVRVSQTYSRQVDALSTLRDAAVPTWSYVASLGGRQDRNGQESAVLEGLAFSTIDDLWDRMTIHKLFLSMLAEAVWGFLHTKKKKNSDPEFSSEVEDETFVPFLKHQSALAPYVVTHDDWLASHDDDQHYWKRGTGPRPCRKELAEV